VDWCFANPNQMLTKIPKADAIDVVMMATLRTRVTAKSSVLILPHPKNWARARVV
jgi:hypothetical protein